jgi:hypothetical protein
MSGVELAHAWQSHPGTTRSCDALRRNTLKRGATSVTNPVAHLLFQVVPVEAC